VSINLPKKTGGLAGKQFVTSNFLQTFIDKQTTVIGYKRSVIFLLARMYKIGTLEA
jgi:hypothetical protein